MTSLETSFLTWNDNTTAWNVVYGIAGVYLTVEVGFYFAFGRYLVPRANQHTTPPAYRDFGHDRCQLLLRIVQRIEKTCQYTKETNVPRKIQKFLSEWFHVALNQEHPQMKQNQTLFRSLSSSSSSMSDFPPGLSRQSTPSSSPECSDNENYEDEPFCCKGEERVQADDDVDSVPVLFKEDVDDFFGWAFFGKPLSAFLPWEQEELDRLYNELETEAGVAFPSRAKAEKVAADTHHCTPRRMSLEPVNALYRPLLVYISVALFKVVAGVFLYARGFRRHVSRTGLVGWFRPAKNPENAFLPTIFFHGIAPAGLVFYLPMVLFGLIPEHERPIFLFENQSISCSIDFHPLTEEETVDGVIELLQKTNCFDKKLSLIGHSFGSCPITWLLASKRLPNIRQVTLLDPVAILLSEPDVMVNFLYAEELDKIRMVAASELFTEYYLRRHFAWYNSELWLEHHLPQDTQILVCLSEQDEIVNTPKVVQELKRLDLDAPTGMLVWPAVGHAACVTSPTMWKQIRERMQHQELQILQKLKDN